MEPLSLARSAQALGKLVGLGLSAWRSREHGPFTTEDWALLNALVDAGLSQAEKRRVSVPARQLALIISAFGEAWRVHWALAERVAPGALALRWSDYFFSAAPQRALLARASARLAHALVKDPEPTSSQDELDRASARLGDPLASPTYRRLLRAFTEPAEGESEVLLVLGEGERLGFERAFLRAYHEGLASPEGASVRAYLLGLVEDRGRLVRDLIVADTAGWAGRHVFGNALRHEVLPPMPLEAIFVEPLATAGWEVGKKAQKLGPRKVLGLLARLLEKHGLALVVGDFGQGKSLTARMLAVELARAFQAGEGASPELPLPVFIRCADDFASAEVDVDRVVRRALHRQARSFGLELPITDAAFSGPAPTQRALFILDGLDEVTLSARQVEALLRELQDRSGPHRFLVFSRPAALPLQAHLPEVPRVQLEKLTAHGRERQPGGQVGEWLEKWNALRPAEPALHAVELARHQLLDEAQTPILLFMIAFTWAAEGPQARSKVELYERFFRQLARGKYEADLDAHPQIARASAHLRELLIGQGRLPASADPIDAMLWLMGRAAWESRRREQGGEHLATFHVERIVREELGVSDAAGLVRSLCTSLLLVLQADLDGEAHRLLFGHRTFAEFAVARHWAHALRRIVDAPSHEGRSLEPLLYGARLMQPGDRAHAFLQQLLFDWDDASRRRLAEWAGGCFNEERPAPEARSFADDPRMFLREAALFLGSVIPEGPGITARGPLTLRSLLAWLWLRGSDAKIHAPGLVSPGAALAGAELSRSDLSQARLAGANLDGARLEGAQLFRADLRGAQLQGALAMGAHLDEAILEQANLRGAFLTGATAVGAKLAGASLYAASCSEADLRRADLTRAGLGHARLERAQLQGATLVGAVLEEAKLAGADCTAADLARANLFGADLRRAKLVRAVLRGATLRDADLRGADLTGAELEGADLHGAKLAGAIGLPPTSAT